MQALRLDAKDQAFSLEAKPEHPESCGQQYGFV